MGDDKHEVSVVGELTESGFKAGVRSRWASAVDRLWGSKVEKKSIPIEAENAELVALSSGRVKMIEALGDLAVEQLKSDPEFAARALENFLPSILKKQENKDAIVEMALEDLRANPPSAADEAEGPQELSEGFLSRFDRYAEDATSDIVREKWARVLASEVRKPATFSGKVLRIIDELEPATAALFERVCAHDIGGGLLKATLGELPFHEIQALVEAELLVEPGLGHVRNCVEVNDADGVGLWLFTFGQRALALTVTSQLPEADLKGVKMTNESGKPALPVYVLTDAGSALTTILPDRSRDLFESATQEILAAAPNSAVRQYSRSEAGGQFIVTRSFEPRLVLKET